MTLDEVLEKFVDVDRRGTDAMARCPHHADGKASLSISDGRDGILLHCHAGCNTGEVLADVGLTFADLMHADTNGNGHRNNVEQKRRIVATYDYVDANANLVFQVVRYDPKDFRQRRPDGAGGWIWNMRGIPRVLYRLPRVVEAVAEGWPVWVAEGEKDVHALEQDAGVMCATTNSGGAGKWSMEGALHTDALRGALVRIVADDDAAGRKHARQVAAALDRVADTVELLLPAKGHKDIAQHLGAGLSLDELRPMPPADDDAPALVGEDDDLEGLVQPRTDDANALRFTKTYGDILRYVPQWSTWLRWDGTRWLRDQRHQVIELARHVIRGIFHDALRASADDRKGALKWSATSGNTPRIRAMVELARSSEGIPVLADELDADHWALNVTNGTVDLRTGTLRAHRQADLITKRAGCAFIPEADAPVFAAFLERILPDPELRLWLQRFAGYCLTGTTGEQVLVFAHGVGANGKTTLIQALLHVLGDYGKNAEPDLLLDRDNAHPTGVADLQGARLVVSSEIEDGRRLAEATVKQLTGQDRIKARYMRQDFFEFAPTHKLLIATNHKPGIRGTDHAIWRRIRLLPFDEVIPKHEQDPDLLERLRDEAEGILAWAVAGCTDWRANGLPTPAGVAAATDAYRAEEDRIGAFLAERCELDRTYAETARALYAAYSSWAEGGGERPLSQKRFGAKLTERGLDRGKLGAANHWHWLGIRLQPGRTPEPPPLGEPDEPF